MHLTWTNLYAYWLLKQTYLNIQTIAPLRLYAQVGWFQTFAITFSSLPDSFKGTSTVEYLIS